MTKLKIKEGNLAETYFNRIVKENNFKKSRGLANLTGLLTDEF